MPPALNENQQYDAYSYARQTLPEACQYPENRNEDDFQESCLRNTAETKQFVSGDRVNNMITYTNKISSAMRMPLDGLRSFSSKVVEAPSISQDHTAICDFDSSSTKSLLNMNEDCFAWPGSFHPVQFDFDGALAPIVPPAKRSDKSSSHKLWTSRSA
jgi:hypothetical protein